MEYYRSKPLPPAMIEGPEPGYSPEGSDAPESRIEAPEHNRLFDREIPTRHLTPETFRADEWRFEFTENAYRDKLPPELRAWREELVAERVAQGERLRNGETLAIDNWQIENGVLTMKTREGKYYDDLATHFSFDHKFANGRTVRSYVDEQQLYQPGGFNKSILACTLGMGIVIETADNKVVLQERSNRVLIEPGAMQQSVGEGVKLADARSGSLDSAITRGLREELGISRTQKVETVGMKFGITDRYLQPTAAAYVRVPLTGEELRSIAETARGRWERNTLHIIPFEAGPLREMIETKRWATPALYCLASAWEMKQESES